jgi:hypothetical protein
MHLIQLSIGKTNLVEFEILDGGMSLRLGSQPKHYMRSKFYMFYPY